LLGNVRLVTMIHTGVGRDFASRPKLR
jgi:hypothetical protein